MILIPKKLQIQKSASMKTLCITQYLDHLNSFLKTTKIF